MSELLGPLHQAWRWVVVASLLVAFIDGVLGLVRRRDWQPRSGTIARVATVAFDVQVLLGVILYVVNRTWQSTDPDDPLHAGTMLVGLVLVHATLRRTRTGATSRRRHMWLAAGALVTLIVAAVGGALALG